jgi:hypothetical protein
MRCPVCRADLLQGPQCRRCKADLSPLFDLKEQRASALRTAYHCLAQGQLNRALAIAGGVDACRHDDESQRLLAIIHLLRGDFAEAMDIYRAGSKSSVLTAD